MLTAAVVGARRARQGIGEHVARYLQRHGAEVRAVVGTSEATVREACAALRERAGIEARGYTSLRALLAEDAPDVVAICSPTPAHPEALEACAAAPRAPHVLCDKPLIFEPAREMGDFVRSVAERLAARGRRLEAITQWPCTLEGYGRLYPGLDVKRTERLWMLMSPTTRGPAMLVDSLPHPISLLRALAGPGRPRGARVAWDGDERATVRFGYDHATGTIDAELRLERREAQPRPAAYALDGLEARREVRMSDYSMELRAPDGRRTALEDPLEALVRGFLERTARGEATDATGLASDAAALQAIMKEVE